MIAAICLTVLLSVLAHGLSADPLARRYGAWVAAHPARAGAARLDRAAQPALAAPPGATLGLTAVSGASARGGRTDGIRQPSTGRPPGAMPRANAEHASPTTALNAS